MYSMDGIMDRLSREANDGSEATIVDKDHRKSIFGESYYIHFRFDDGYEDRMKVSSDRFSRSRVGDRIAVDYK